MPRLNRAVIRACLIERNSTVFRRWASSHVDRARTGGVPGAAAPSCHAFEPAV